jgi:SAM-dependent MidA family methyltransferase
MWDVSRVGETLGWRAAMARALYGDQGFFTHGGAHHFRTSANSSAAFAAAILRVVVAADEALGRPPRLDVVDVGAGTGHLLRQLDSLAPAQLRGRLRLTAVELAARPADLPASIAWTDRLAAPASVEGLLVATEWLDNVPLDIAAGTPLRYMQVEPRTGDESAGPILGATDAAWARTWWPEGRVELGRTRDEAWAGAVATLARGLALAVDYGHSIVDRPRHGTLTGFRGGREVDPVPDGTCDITAHVAVDSARAAGEAVAGTAAVLTTQARALRALGISGLRPPLDLATADPATYVRELAGASHAAELTDPGGLGAHWWIVQPVGIAEPPPFSGVAR